MQRGSFFKSLATLLIAPKILSKIDWTKAIAKAKPPTKALFNDLQILIPEWYPKMMEKYGDKNYADLLSTMSTETMVKSKTFQYWDNETGRTRQSDKPISATITL